MSGSAIHETPVNEDPWAIPAEPTPADLEALERLGEQRRAIEAREGADRHQAALRRLLLATLDEMEEAICLHGHDDPRVAACRERLAAFAAASGLDAGDDEKDREATDQPTDQGGRSHGT